MTKTHDELEFMIVAADCVATAIRQCQIPNCDEAASATCDCCDRAVCKDHIHHFNPDECAAQCETSACEVCCS